MDSQLLETVLERARYDVARAQRDYQAVEPENRLGARSLERQWEEALASQETLQAEPRRFLREQPATLSAPEREARRRLAQDIPALWHAPSTTVADRQASMRQRVERIEVTLQGERERVEVMVHWRGGHQSQATMSRPVARLEQLSDIDAVRVRVATLPQQGRDRPTIAAILNAEGWRPAKRRPTFTAEMVGALFLRQGLGSGRPSRVAKVERQGNEWTVSELAHTVEIPPPTLSQWLRQGSLQARQARHVSAPVWLIWAAANELERLRAFRPAARPQRWPAPTELAGSAKATPTAPLHRKPRGEDCNPY
jgi:hypothetical protein